MEVYEKIFGSIKYSDIYICLKNNTTQLYFILGTAELYRNSFKVSQDGSDIYRFPTVDMNFLQRVCWDN